MLLQIRGKNKKLDDTECVWNKPLAFSKEATAVFGETGQK